MMRTWIVILLLALLLGGCAKPAVDPAQTGAVPSSAPESTEPASPEESAGQPSLVGVWVNAGQYGEGRDFVETLTLREDGGATVHLDYQGSSYATLEGRWEAKDGTLAVRFSDANTRDREYAYALTGTTLTLRGDGKTVEYVRQEPEEGGR